MEKIKKILSICLIFSFSLVNSYAVDTSSGSVTSSSSDNYNFFSTGGLSGGSTQETKYYNKDTNSDIIGDYLSGYYYNVLYGFFKLDWSADKTNNVRIIGSTSKCSSGYGYKFGGYAKSGTGTISTAGLINFNYDDNTFVYYCMDDKKLYGKAYSSVIGFQNFNGISLEILPNLTPNIIPPTQDAIFVNNTTTIFSNSNTQSNISGDIQSKRYGQEAVFYIWKPKK